ncbi:hypothetical protein ACFL00_00415 [Pseudomonadota bacterium]
MITRIRLRRLVIFACAVAGFLAMAFFQAATAQENLAVIYHPDPDSPPGERNPDGAAELAQFEFLIGNWDVEVTYYGPDGNAINYKAEFHNIWIVDGLVIFQEWRGPYTTGAEFRSYDKKSNTWPGNNFYPGRGWWAAESVWDKNKRQMVVTSKKTDQRGEAINKEIYFDITSSSFKIRSEASYDKGETWERGTFELTAKKRNS